MIRPILQLLILLSLISCLSGQRSEPPPSQKKAGSLRLPSFSIFGLSPSTVPKEFDKPLSPTEFDQFLTEILRRETENKIAKNERPFWVIPMVFYKSRNLFSKESWSIEEIEEGQQISKFFARLTGKPDLEIKGSGQQAFRIGLISLKDWFASMCHDNKMLASMIFTLDDGPFFGVDIDVDKFPKMKLIESAPIPDKQASFLLMTDGDEPESMVIGILNDDKSVRWLRSYSNSPQGRITDSWLQKPAIYRIESYGYAVALMTDGSSGTERSRVYLDESLNLRFYYVSW
jgi:hypothetical protein